MGYILVALGGILIIWTIYFINVRRANNNTNQSTASKIEKPHIKTEDELYADAHNMWVCRHCETLNASYKTHCEACGMAHWIS